MSLGKAMPKYSLNFNIRFNQFDYYISTEKSLTEYEIKLLEEILSVCPNRGNLEWLAKFSDLNVEKYSQELLQIAANACDENGNTMLGIACAWGKYVPVKKLIYLGAKLHTRHDHMDKSALHWALTASPNLREYFKPDDESKDIINLFLNLGFDVTKKSYDNLTVLEYAQSRKYFAAVNLMETHLKNKMAQNRLSAGMFKVAKFPRTDGNSFFDVGICRLK